MAGLTVTVPPKVTLGLPSLVSAPRPQSPARRAHSGTAAARGRGLPLAAAALRSRPRPRADWPRGANSQYLNPPARRAGARRPRRLIRVLGAELAAAARAWRPAASGQNESADLN